MGSIGRTAILDFWGIGLGWLLHRANHIFVFTFWAKGGDNIHHYIILLCSRPAFFPFLSCHVFTPYSNPIVILCPGTSSSKSILKSGGRHYYRML